MAVQANTSGRPACRNSTGTQEDHSGDVAAAHAVGHLQGDGDLGVVMFG
jgi:hypothetical protein